MTRLAALLALVTTPAWPCDYRPDSAALLIGSHHAGVGPDVTLNERNLGLFLAWECGDLQTRAGIFNNSFDDTAFALTFRHETVTFGFGYGDIGLFGGLAYYPDLPIDKTHYAVDGWFPIVGVEVTAGPVFAQVLPGGDELDFDWIASFGFRMDF